MQADTRGPDVSTLDDAALLAVVVAEYGRRAASSILNEAVGALYDRYGRLVYSVAYHSTGNVEIAEEITQDVFVRACSNAHTYRSEKAKVSSWLVSIARHRAIDELRRRSIRPENSQVDWPEDVGMDHVPGMPLSEGPEQIVETSMQKRSLHQLMAELPPEQRQVLALAFFRGMSHSQIAELLAEPLGTVKSRVRLAMQRLRDRLVERGIIEP
jgi:RNA polymerase sigma-70 factor (ECF subfamily)